MTASGPPAAGHPRVRIVVAVLDWNGYALTEACLASLAGLHPSPFRTVVVDNGSTVPVGPRLAAAFPAVEHLRLPENVGVAGGYNAAFRWSRQAGATHVLLLNNDVLVAEADLLARLVDAFDPTVAAAGPRVLRPDGTTMSTGGWLQRPWFITHHRRDLDVADRPVDVEWLDGSCLLVSLEAACAVGGFEDAFFLYWEEVDWCHRARAAGYRCVVQPAASVVHAVGGTASPASTSWFMLRNAILFARRHGSRRENVLALLRIAARPARRLLGRRTAPSLGLTVRAIAWNVRDAARRRAWRVPPGGPDVCGGDQPDRRAARASS